MKKFAKSVLEKIIQDVYQAKTLQEGQKIMFDFIEGTKIEERDKQKMLNELEQIPNLTKLWVYITNAMFRFEGLSVNSYKEK